MNQKKVERRLSEKFSYGVLQELLNSTAEWKSVPEIVRLSFKAVLDLQKVHTKEIVGLGQTSAKLMTREEITSMLALKANSQDVTRWITQLQLNVRKKLNKDEMENSLMEYCTRLQMKKEITAVQKEPSYQIKQIIEKTQDQRMQEFQKEVAKKVAGCATLTQLQDVYSVLQNKVNLADFNETMQTKVSKQSLMTMMNKKVNKSDFQQFVNKNLQDLEEICSTLESKIDVTTIQKLTEIIQNKSDRCDLNLFLANVQEKLDQIGHSQQLDSLKSKLLQLQNKFEGFKDHQLRRKDEHVFLPVQQVSKRVNTLQLQLSSDILKLGQRLEQVIKKVQINGKSKVEREMEDFRVRLEQISQRKVDRKEWIDWKSRLITLIEEKVSREELQFSSQKILSAQEQKQNGFTRQIQKAFKSLENNLNSQMSQLVSKEAFQNGLNKKADRIQLQDLNESLNKRKKDRELKDILQRALEQIQNKVNKKDFVQEIQNLKGKVGQLKDECSKRAAIQEVCTLVDAKPNIDDVNQALKLLHQELDLKIGENQLKTVVNEQANVNSFLCAENILGRWVWRSGDLKAGGMIPWQVQEANLMPDNFLWEKEKTSILTMIPGFYQIILSIFSRKKPTVVLQINGDPVVTLQARELSQTRKRRFDTPLTGHTLRQIFMLPARARLSVSFAGESTGEGFMNVRRI